MEFPELVLKGDAAGIERATGIFTGEHELKELHQRVMVRVTARSILEAHGEAAINSRLRTEASGGPFGIDKVPQSTLHRGSCARLPPAGLYSLSRSPSSSWTTIQGPVAPVAEEEGDQDMADAGNEQDFQEPTATLCTPPTHPTPH